MNEAQKECKEKAKIWIFGQPFRPMVEKDFEGLEGADEGCLISFPSDDVILVYNPASKEVHEIWDGGERLWALAEVLTN